MKEASPEAEPTEREHREALASLQALDRAMTRDWQAVALGQRDLDEVVAERAAAGDDPDSSERAKLLFRPYDDLEQRRLLDAVLAGSAKSGRRRWSTGLSLAAIAAAVAILVVMLAGPRGGVDPSPRMASLPAYQIETDGGLAKTRSTPQPESGPIHYAPANEFEWTIRPREDIRGPQPDFAVIARDTQGRATPVFPTAHVADSGAIRLTGTIADLGLAPGEWTIEVVLLRASGWNFDAVVVTKPLVLEPPA
jgi:hypothetical protein